MPNKLINETSPYLLQHAHNPVDWNAWDDDALARARDEDRPILLSIGYAACHWCHVMERESFEDPVIAAIMNEKFICIKVDREERPEIDAIYMDAVQAMTGHGGWPMTMFLAPDGTPFYGGTYFPPDDRHGLPSFRKVLEAVHDAWLTKRDTVVEQGRSLIQQIDKQSRPGASREPMTNSLITHGVEHLAHSFDTVNGGFGDSPKFPQAPVLEFLLRAATLDLGRSREMIDTTLTRMAMGGIYDQLGGGFSRYSVDETWLVPHFEKMLYDNAQLARVYTRAWQLTKKPLFLRIATETLDYLLKDMCSAEGGFYASEDADSEGVEGKFYAWSHEEFVSIAPGEAAHYGVTPEGNFEGLNILTGTLEQAPVDHRIRLLQARSSRVRPARDEKVLTSWNGLTISALAEAGAAFGREDFVEAARSAATMLVPKASDRLHHSHKDGVVKVLGLLEDYAFLAEGLLTLWEVTFEPRWFDACKKLCEQTIELFWDKEEGGFFTTGSDHERLILRQKEIVESATPSPNAVASLVLQRMAVITGNQEWATKAETALRLAHSYMARAPQASGTSLCALDFWLSGAKEIVLVGENTEAFKEVIRSRYLPNRVMVGSPPGIDSPMLTGKTALNGKPTAYVCKNYTCQAPTTNPSALASQLDIT